MRIMKDKNNKKRMKSFSHERTQKNGDLEGVSLEGVDQGLTI